MKRECYLCKSKDRDEVKYGEFMTRGKISVHYFCLLLTSNLMQRGNDDEGFLGFLEDDIKEEAQRVKSAVCCYCKKNSANISCCASKCYRSFHLVCGENKSTNFQFVGTFKSFCDRHVTGKKVSKPTRDETCCICCESILCPLGRFDSVQMIKAPCCKNGWFHKNCLAAFAKTAGYFFKCPLCNDSNIFRTRLTHRGIFIPDRDAAWELEPNAFVELLERPKSCSAKICCGVGRETITDNNNLINCSICGSVAIHRLCISNQTNNFFCDECISLSGGIENLSFANMSNNQTNNSESEEEETGDEEINVCDNFDEPPLTCNITENCKENESILPTVKSALLSEDRESEIKSKYNVKNEQNIFISNDLSTSNNNSSNVKGRKRINHDSPKDNETPNSSKRMRFSSCEAESLFDSGAESDRSGTYGDKCNIKSVSETSVNGFSKNTNLFQVVVRLKKLDDLDVKKTVRRFSMNDFVDQNTKEFKTKRWLSECSESYVKMRQTQQFFEKYNKEVEIPGTFKLRDKQSNIVNVTLGLQNDLLQQETHANIENNISKAIALPVTTRKQIQETCKTQTTEIDELEDSGTEELSTSNIKLECEHLSPKKSLQTTKPFNQKIRRKSRLQGPEEVSLEQVTRKVRSSSEDLATNSIKRHTVMSNIHKRHKRCSLSYETENTFQKYKNTEILTSRGRSPLSVNTCDVYAYITPAYVKKQDSKITDKPSVAEKLVTTDPISSDLGHLFRKSSSNIPQLPNTGSMKPESDDATNKNQLLKQTFFNSYSLLFRTTEKPNPPQKHLKKRNNHHFMRQALPSNQTRIESFFKRV